MPPCGMPPFTEFRRQGPVFLTQALILKILQSLVNKVQSVINQMGGLFRCHDSKNDW